MASTSKFIYDLEGFKYSSDKDLSGEQLDELYDKFEQTGVIDARLNDAQEIYRADLIANKEFLNSYRDIHFRLKGKEFEGNDEELVDDYYSQMRWWENNLPALGDLAFKLQGDFFDETNKQNMAVVWDTWEHVAPFYMEEGAQWGKFFKDFGVANALDVTNIVNVGGLVGAGAKAASSKAAKEAIKYQIKNKVIKKALGALTSDVIKNKAITSAAEVGLYSFADDQLRQNIDQQILGQEGTDWGVTAARTGVGAALGGTLGALTSTGTKLGVEKGFKDLSKFKASHPKLGAFAEKIDYIRRGTTPKEVAAQERVGSAAEQANSYVKAYEKWQADILEAKDVGGEAGKAFRTEASNYFYDTIGKWFDLENGVKTNEGVFIRRGTQKVGFDTATSKEATVDLIEALNSLPSLKKGKINAYTATPAQLSDLLRENKYALLETLEARRSKKPLKVKGLDGSKVIVKGEEQYEAVMIGLHNSLYQSMRDLVDSRASTDQLTDVIESFAKLTGALKESGTSKGRGLYYHRYLTIKDFDIDALKELDPLQKVSMVEKMAAAGDMDEALTYANSVSKWLQAHAADRSRKGVNWLKELYISNILGGTSSLFFNTASSAAQLAFRNSTEYVGGVLRGSAGKAMRKQAKAQLEYLFDGQMWTQTLDLTYKAFLKSQGQIDSRTFVETTEHAFTKDIDLSKGLADVDSFGTVVKNMIKLIGHRGMLTTDELMGNVAFRSRAYAIAFTEEISKEGATKATAMKAAQDRVAEAVTKQLEAVSTGTPSLDPLIKKALAETRTVKYQGDLEKGFDVGQIGRTLQKWSHPVYSEQDEAYEVAGKAVGSLLSTMVVPFTRTPANLINATFEMTPGLAMLSKKFRRTMYRGTAEEKAQAHAALILGSGLWGTAIAAVANGDFTGNGAGDYVQRKVQMDGNRLSRYTVPSDIPVVGGMSFDRFEPFNAPLKVLVDLQDILRYGSEEDGTNAFITVSLHFANLLTDYPAFQGVQRLSKMGSVLSSGLSPEDKWNKTEVAFGQYLSSFVPFYRVLNEWYGQDEIHELRSWLDPVKQNIPYFREFGDIKRDPILGEPAVRDPYLFGGPLVPIRKRKEGNDLVDQEIVKIGMKMQKPVPTVFGLDLREFTYDTKNGRSYYDRYQELVGQVKNTDYGTYWYGKDLHGALEEIITTAGYQQDISKRTYGGKLLSKGSLSENTRRERLETAVASYRQRALLKLREEIMEKAMAGDKEAIKFAKDFDKVYKWNQETKAKVKFGNPPSQSNIFN